MNNLYSKIFVCMFSAVIFIVTIETMARIEGKIKWGADILTNYSSDNLKVSDQYGVHNRFNTKFEKWEINKYGFRGPDIEKNKSNQQIRIMFLGASETFGLYEQKEAAYPFWCFLVGS